MNSSRHTQATGQTEHTDQPAQKPKSDARRLRSISQLATSFNRRRNSTLNLSTSSDPATPKTSNRAVLPNGASIATRAPAAPLSPHLLPRRTVLPRSVTLTTLPPSASQIRSRITSSYTTTNLINSQQVPTQDGCVEVKRPWIRSTSSITRWRQKQTTQQTPFDDSSSRRQLARATQAAATAASLESDQTGKAVETKLTATHSYVEALLLPMQELASGRRATDDHLSQMCTQSSSARTGLAFTTQDLQYPKLEIEQSPKQTGAPRRDRHQSLSVISPEEFRSIPSAKPASVTEPANVHVQHNQAEEPCVVLERPPNKDTSASTKKEDDNRNVYEAQPSSYWTGRFVSLSDKFLNDGEGDEIPDPGLKDAAILMRMQEERRARRIFFILLDCCKTPEARRSLLVSFTRMFSRLSPHTDTLYVRNSTIGSQAIVACLKPCCLAVSSRDILVSRRARHPCGRRDLSISSSRCLRWLVRTCQPPKEV